MNLVMTAALAPGFGRGPATQSRGTSSLMTGANAGFGRSLLYILAHLCQALWQELGNPKIETFLQKDIARLSAKSRSVRLRTCWENSLRISGDCSTRQVGE